jgi:hypothetical protein
MVCASLFGGIHMKGGPATREPLCWLGPVVDQLSFEQTGATSFY